MKRLIRAACLLGMFFGASVVFAASIEPRAGGAGTIRLTAWRGSTAADHKVWVRKNRGTWIYLGKLSGSTDVINTGLQVKSGDRIDVQMDSSWGPTFSFSSPDGRIRNSWSENGRRYCGEEGMGESPTDVTSLWTNSNELLSLTCWEDWDDWDYNDFALRVDYIDGNLPPPPDLSAVCSDRGDHVTLSWGHVAGAVDYVVRLNRAPSGDWLNPDEGDQFFRSGGATTVVRDVECGRDYTWSVQGVEQGESYPYSGGLQWVGPFNCACGGKMRVNAVDPSGNPVNAGEIRVSEIDWAGWYPYWSTLIDSCASCSSLTANGFSIDRFGAGGYVVANPNQTVLGATPHPNTGYWYDGGRSYYWESPDMSNDYTVDVVVATKTPTPQPYVEVSAIDPQGNPVEAAELVGSRASYHVDYHEWVWFRDLSQCQNCSVHQETDVDRGAGGYAVPKANQVVLGVTPEPADGDYVRTDDGYYWDDVDEEKSVKVVLATKEPPEIIVHTFHDCDANGIQDVGEPGLSGYLVGLFGGSSSYTGPSGTAEFEVGPGSWTFWADDNGHPMTTDDWQSVDVGYDETEHVHFGFVLPVEIRAHVFRDDDGDGVQDAGEPGFSNIGVQFSDGVSGVTEGNGVFTRSQYPGDFIVDVDEDDSNLPTGAVPTTPTSQNVDLAGCETEDVYFGFQVPGMIRAYTFQDDNGNGSWDSGEDEIRYVRVDLSNGDYGYTNYYGREDFEVAPGYYVVDVDENDNSIPSNAVLTTPGSQGVTVDAGETERVYFGFRVPGRIIARTFFDDNGNGHWDSGEDPLPYVRVDLSSGAYGSTNSSGREVFVEWPGYYVVDVHENDSSIPSDAVLTTPGTRGVNLDAGDTDYADFGFQRLCGTIQEIVYLDENDNAAYDSGTDTPLPNITVSIDCPYGYGDTTSTNSNGRYSFSGMPRETCVITVDEADPDLPERAELVEGNSPADVLCTGERYGFAVSDTWEGSTPSGEVFVHVYVHGLADDQADYLADDLIHLDIQRWSGLAPIFRPDEMPEICLEGTLTCTVASEVMTERFVLEDIDGDGRAIENLTGRQPTFDYPNGQEVVYNHLHQWGDTNYDDGEYLWVLLLSQGGVTPDDGLAAPPHTQAIAETGYPGTYQVEGMLYLSSQFTGPVTYEHEWSIPIEFYITQRAPYPQVP